MLRLLNRLTLTQQWVLATLLAILPLVAAVLYAAHHLSLQAQSQRQMVADIARLSDLDALINSQMASVERSARQYQLLRNPRFLALFQQNVAALQPALDQMQIQRPATAAVGEVRAALEALVQQLSEDASAVPDGESVALHLSRANQGVRDISADVDERSQVMLDQRDQQFEQVMRHLWLIGIFALPGTLLLVILSSVTVTRPVWRLANAIREMGHGHWQQPIRISGPADLRSLGSSLEWMRERLDTTEKQKRAFVRHVTHELKTPLAAIVEAGSLLLDEVPGAANEAQKQVIRILMRNADHLQVLIQQLLNYNAVAHGILNAEADVDLLALCHKLRTKLMESRPTSRCRWSIGGTPRVVHTDPQALDMILSNLLSNAHDFAPESGRVAVTWGQDAESWWLAVSDNGPGLSEEERERIFLPFYQGRARRQGPLKGSGLGLSIVQECVQHLRGTIGVSSSSEGSQFRLCFPLSKENRA